jgi:hypothetical protein
MLVFSSVDVLMYFKREGNRQMGGSWLMKKWHQSMGQGETLPLTIFPININATFSCFKKHKIALKYKLQPADT